MKKKDAMVKAIRKELVLRKNEFEGEEVQTLYFGGGTPSVLDRDETDRIIQTVYENYQMTPNPEITLEANPDDLSKKKLKELSASRVNRLSIGVQSFFDEDLRLMNRAHSAEEAEACIGLATMYFDNISIDLIYGIPGMDNERWQQNIEKALSFKVPHISSYALTVESGTVLKKWVDEGTVREVDDEVAEGQFRILADRLEQAGFIHYEISNFGKPNYFSRNNTAYWQGKKYIGIGPSAHSYDGKKRRWNVRNNTRYIESIAEGRLIKEEEVLSKKDRYNEYVMTGLRTIWGVSLPRIEREYGAVYHNYLLLQAQKFMNNDLLRIEEGTLLATKKGKFLVDGIASELFMLNLEKK
jgi:oxygen-independent coproporphyrinogen-3 oxidase